MTETETPRPTLAADKVAIMTTWLADVRARYAAAPREAHRAHRPVAVTAADIMPLTVLRHVLGSDDATQHRAIDITDVLQTWARATDDGRRCTTVTCDMSDVTMGAIDTAAAVILPTA